MALEASSSSQALKVTVCALWWVFPGGRYWEDRTTPAPGRWAARGQKHSEPGRAVKSVLVPWGKDREGMKTRSTKEFSSVFPREA